MEFNLPDPIENVQLDDELLKKHLKATGGGIVTRFPPEPNGYLHLGHVKAMFTNFMYAKIKNGKCYMRFDDTNPSKEKQEYIDAILEDIKWMGYEPYKITYTSDYFDILFDYAIKLIEMDKAYICELNEADMRQQRYDCVESSFRNRPIDESLRLFNEMKEGKHKEGSMTLRLKCDMKHGNPNMRDIVAFRILFKEHPRTGNKWVIYSTYDYSHPIVDSLENITHSLCSSEFKIRNELYRWVTETLGIYRCPQIEYSRLNLTNTILSKRKLIELVNDGIVNGWDDPRMPTIKGLKRRGYTPEALNDFCGRIGLNLVTSSSKVSYGMLEECLRQDLEIKAPRVMAILNPLKVVINNLKDDEFKIVSALDFPNMKDKSPTHEIKVGNVLYIDKEDFRTVDTPKYFRLAPGKIVRLKYFGLVKYVSHNDDENTVHVELLDYIPEKRVQGTINWVSECDHLNVEVRKYDHLFPEESHDNWKEMLNKNNSKKIFNIMTDTSIKGANIFDKFQFERIGYFCVDPDTRDDHIVLNMTVELKVNKNK